MLLADNDIAPSLWIESKSGEQTYVGLDERLFASQENKELAFRAVIPETVKMFDAARFAFVSAAWQLVTNEKRFADGRSIENEPDRVEIVQVNVYDPDSAWLYVARMKRNPGKTADIGEWETFDIVKSSGRFKDLWQSLA
jgi:uncharacterized protein (DUF1684 family)